MAPTSRAIARLRGLPTLIVDDHPINRRILQDVLAQWGMRPTAVDSGRAALAALRHAAAQGEPFVLVLLDAMMPDLEVMGRDALLASAGAALQAFEPVMAQAPDLIRGAR